MSLHEALIKRGYAFRQHIEEEGWVWRKATVIDLDAVQSDALKFGGADGLRKAFEEQLYRPPWGVFSFPALDIEKPLPRSPDLVLSRKGVAVATVVAPESDPHLSSMAREFVDALTARYGVALPLAGDGELKPDLLDTRHVILFGGSHQNRLALDFALRYRTFFIDASVPGDDGWAVTTHCGLHASGHNIAQAVAPAAHRSTVLQTLLEGVVREGDDLILRHIHRIQPGREMAAHFPPWERFTAGLPGRLPVPPDPGLEAPRDIKALADLLALGLDSGGREKNYYNIAPVDIAIDCARYYQLSADPRALDLFRELLFRLTDYYLKTPGGASYPADLDFRLGLLILHFSRLEHLPAFDEDDRLILANLLLSCTRAVHEYARKIWPISPENPKRHNHPTFKALSLLYAAHYFSRFQLPSVRDWLGYTEAVFNGDLWKRSKQSENSRAYEPFVFDHAACYALFTGRGLELFAPGCYEGMTARQIAATDNFFRAVDYGDTGIDMQPVDSMSARLLAIGHEGIIRWFAGEGFARQPVYLSASIMDYPGLRLGRRGAPIATGDWECMPLDPAFLEEVSPGFPREAAFDKLAFRTGWGDEDQYLLVEGVGGKSSHSHRETNGIVRLNHLGRHWMVSNGYGRRVGITNISTGFSTRELGPVDHNMLVIQREGRVVDGLPMGSLLQRGRSGRLLFATSALLGYGGTNWFRTFFINAGRYLLVIDRIHIVQPGVQKAHVEWNALGQASIRENGFRLGQKGVFMDVTSPSGWAVEQKVADQSACWKRVLENGSYPFAAFPLAKLVFHMPGVEAGQTHCLATLLAATRGEATYAISQPGPGHIRIDGSHEDAGGATIRDRDLAVDCDTAQCDIRFANVMKI